MEQSPLTQQARPDVFEPKVVGLYRRLFKDVEDDERPDQLSESFWLELFILKPEIPRLREIIEEVDGDFLLHMPHYSQQLVRHGIAQIQSAHAPSDEHALDTLTVFFAIVLAKRYSNPSSDIIEILAGLDRVDVVFSDLVSTLEKVIRDGHTFTTRQKAVKTAIAVISGGYQSALVSYFVQRDFFPALMKLVHQLDDPLQASEPLVLIGLLANYNKFEIYNPYRLRFSDFVNDDVMKKVVECIAASCNELRQRYVTIQDDTPTGWTLTGTLSYVGLGLLAGAKSAAPVLTEDQQKQLFSELPGPETATILTLYDFIQANRLFCHTFIIQPSGGKGQTAPFGAFLSFTSYIYQHAFRTSRASSYAYLTLLILTVLVEEPTTAKLLCDTTAIVPFCRQRPPFLPLPKGERTYAAALIDVLTDGMNHNLRKRLDTTFYRQTLAVLSRLLTNLAKFRTKLTYHWSELWRSLLSFVRFLTTYANELKPMDGTADLVHKLVDLLAFALAAGEAFLPDAAAYDDLFYKLVESGDALTKLRETYELGKPDDTSPINTLIAVSKHYRELIESQQAKKEHLSPREIDKIIKAGYSTLNIDSRERADKDWRFREADHKVELKKIVRVVVADAVLLVSTN